MPARSFLSRDISHGEASRRQEKRTAKKLGGRRQPGSGNQEAKHKKGDIVAGRWLGEHKRTSRGARIVITLAMMDKIEREAAAVGKLPFLIAEVQLAARVDGAQFFIVPVWVARQVFFGEEAAT
jgi:hypothetical protein